MKFKIAVIKGDGIGPEVVNEAIKVLNAVGNRFGHTFHFQEVVAGGQAIDSFGEPLPAKALDTCRASDSVLLGAVGGPRWDALPGHLRPERALLGLRSGLDLFANIRPAVLFPALKGACPLRQDIAEKGIDLVVVRESTGGIYFGKRGRKNSGADESAYDTELYSRMEVERIARIAFETAAKRRKHVTSIDKANILESSRLWREVVHEVASSYPDITLADMLVDNAAMQLVRNPSAFDVIVTSNMFGDILSDEAAQITGSIGILASASLGSSSLGMYEPIHGSAPDIAGQGKANPIATILSAAMMLKMSFGLEEEAYAVEKAVNDALEAGYRTGDIMEPGKKLVGTETMGRVITENILKANQ
ncbi:MAG: 3-isopropylmalate dehydrogenase [Bacillota bacterium]|nr:3-isopropylmalate dehydrogenase [Bacillota bacterium]